MNFCAPQEYAGTRKGMAGLAAAGAGLVVFTANPIALGAAAGLMVAGSSGLLVDHYSEKRARLYAASLDAAQAGR